VLITKIKEGRFVFTGEPKNVYALMQKIVLNALNLMRFKEVESNPLLTTIVEDVKRLIVNLNTLLHKRVVEANLYHFLLKASPFTTGRRSVRRYYRYPGTCKNSKERAPACNENICLGFFFSLLDDWCKVPFC